MSINCCRCCRVHIMGKLRPELIGYDLNISICERLDHTVRQKHADVDDFMSRSSYMTWFSLSKVVHFASAEYHHNLHLDTLTYILCALAFRLLYVSCSVSLNQPGAIT